ncbi:hypothetical protein PHYSODRAFT_498289, partial [Phytophthora sojae]
MEFVAATSVRRRVHHQPLADLAPLHRTTRSGGSFRIQFAFFTPHRPSPSPHVSTMVLTSSQICSMLFTDVGNGFYKCTSCDKQYKNGNGYTNLLSHLQRNHDNYEQEPQEASRRQNPLRLHLVSTRTRDLYRWLEWLPASFGLVRDGWTSGGRHYIAIFAVFGSDSTVEVEEDMGAQSQYDLIADTLSRYNKPWSAVKFMEGAIPFIGCASHRFNLAMKDFFKTEDELIAKVHALMTKLRTIMGRGLLRRVSHL